MTNPPRESWTAPDGSQYLDLQPGVRYNFVLAVSDEGGVERAHIRLPNEFIVSDLVPATVNNSTGPIMRSLTLTGNRSDPRTGLVISGNFVAPPGAQSFEFQMEGDDFGGSSGRSNQRFMNVNAYVGSP